MTYIPATLDREDLLRVDAWLVRNGCRHHVALEPVIIRGNYVEYTALSRRDRKSLNRMPIIDYEPVTLGRKRLRIRYPLHGGKP